MYAPSMNITKAIEDMDKARKENREKWEIHKNSPECTGENCKICAEFQDKEKDFTFLP